MKIATAFEWLWGDRVKVNAFWIGLDLGVRALGGALILVMLARELGPDAFGNYVYVSAVMAIPLAVCMLGLNPVVKRNFAEEPQLAATTFGSATVVRLCVGLVAIGCVCVFAATAVSSSLGGLLVIASLSLLQPMFGVGDQWYHAKGWSSFVAKWRLGVYVGSLLALLFGLWRGFDVWFYVAVWVSDLLVASGGLWILCVFRLLEDPLRVEWSLVKGLLRQSRYVLLASFAASFAMQADIVVVRLLFSEEQFGIYSVATRLTRILFSFAVILSTAYFPCFVGAGENKAKQSEFYLLSFLIPVAMGGIAFVIGTPLVVLLFGETYAYAGELWKAHVWTCLGYLMLGATSPYIAKIGKFHLSSLLNLILLVLSYGLTFVLAHLHGLRGGVLGFALAYFFAGVVACWIIRDLRPHARAQWRAISRLQKAVSRNQYKDEVAQ